MNSELRSFIAALPTSVRVVGGGGGKGAGDGDGGGKGGGKFLMPTSKAPLAVKGAGEASLTSMVSILQAPTTVTRTSSSSASVSSKKRQAVQCGFCGKDHYGKDCDQPQAAKSYVRWGPKG